MAPGDGVAHAPFPYGRPVRGAYGPAKNADPMLLPRAVKRLVLKGLAAASSEDLPDCATRAGESDAGRRGPTAHWGVVPLLGPRDVQPS